MAEETAVLDAPIETTAPAAEPAAESSTPTTQPESVGQSDKPDNRRNPDALRKTLKWLRENGGEHSARAQEIERALGELKSWKTIAGNVREAREIKSAVDAIGGVAKIAELQQSAAHMAEIDAKIEAGDPSVLDEIFEFGGKGIAKLLPEILKRVGESDSAAMSKIATPMALEFMGSQGIVEAIDAMVDAFNGGKPDDAKRALAWLVNKYKQLKGSVEATPAKNPEQEAWEKERDTERAEIFKGKVSATFDKVIAHAETTLDRYLAADRKRLRLSEESYDLLRNDAWKYLEAARNKNPIFRSTIGTKINEKSRQISPDAVEFLNGYTNDLAKDAAKKAVEIRYGSITPAAVTETKKDNPTAPPTATAQIDHDMTRKKLGGRDAAQSAILRGEAFDKSGKKIVKAGNVWKYA